MKLIDLKLSRLIPGPADEVFDVWFDPNSSGGPWHGAKKAIMNLVGTQLTILHRGLPDDERGHDHERGWTYCLSRLQNEIERGGHSGKESSWEK